MVDIGVGPNNHLDNLAIMVEQFFFCDQVFDDFCEGLIQDGDSFSNDSFYIRSFFTGRLSASCGGDDPSRTGQDIFCCADSDARFSGEFSKDALNGIRYQFPHGFLRRDVKIHCRPPVYC